MKTLLTTAKKMNHPGARHESRRSIPARMNPAGPSDPPGSRVESLATLRRACTAGSIFRQQVANVTLQDFRRISTTNNPRCNALTSTNRRVTPTVTKTPTVTRITGETARGFAGISSLRRKES